MDVKSDGSLLVVTKEYLKRLSSYGGHHMKKFILIAAALSISTASFAKEINVQVKGMVCSMCAQGIKKKFSKLDEVKEINVDLDKKIVLIQTKDDKDISDADITKIITEAGYNVANIERK